MRQEILNTIDKTDGIPTPPVVALNLMQMALDEDVSLKKLAEKIATDVALCAKILRVVNSAYYGLPQKINNIQQAIVILGGEAVRNLVLAVSVFNSFSDKENQQLYNRLIESSLCSAVAARSVAKIIAPRMSDDAFVAGLMENIGMLLMLYTIPEDYTSVFREAEEQGVDLLTVEDEILHINHIEVGSIVAERWSLPDTIKYPIHYHHNADWPMKELSEEDVLLCKITYLSGLISDVFFGWNKSAKIAEFKTSINDYFKIDADLSEKILYSIEAEIENAAGGFQIELESEYNFHDILNAANVELGRLNMKYEELYRETKLLVAELKQKNEELDRLSREVMEKNIQLQDLADKDGLTKAYNHRYFKDYLEHQLYQYKRNKVSLSLIMIDIDFFKKINDTYGHQAGDQVLQQLSAILRQKTRQSDLVARYGGEEFAIVLNSTDVQGAAQFGEKIREFIEDYNFKLEGNEILHVTVSIGIGVVYSGISGSNQLIEMADKMLYHSKRNGRNRITIPKLSTPN
jgi:two-component system cell cycle response regulator